MIYLNVFKIIHVYVLVLVCERMLDVDAMEEEVQMLDACPVVLPTHDCGPKCARLKT